MKYMAVEHVRENVCEMQQKRMHVEDIRIRRVSELVGETQEDVADILTLRQAVKGTTTFIHVFLK